MKLLKIIPQYFSNCHWSYNCITISEAQQMLNQLSYNAGSADGA